jgi:hypothetical protein
VLAGDDAFAVDLEAGQRLGVGAGGQHDVRSGVAGAVDLHRVGCDKSALALDDGDAGSLEQSGQAAEHAVDNAVLVLVDARHVDALEGRADAEVAAVAGVVGDLARMEQRLGGNASAVQAGAAQLVPFDEGDLEVELGRAQRTRVAAAASTQDHKVERGAGVVRHGVLRAVDRNP